MLVLDINLRHSRVTCDIIVVASFYFRIAYIVKGSVRPFTSMLFYPFFTALTSAGILVDIQISTNISQILSSCCHSSVSLVHLSSTQTRHFSIGDIYLSIISALLLDLSSSTPIVPGHVFQFQTPETEYTTTPCPEALSSNAGTGVLLYQCRLLSELESIQTQTALFHESVVYLSYLLCICMASSPKLPSRFLSTNFWWQAKRGWYHICTIQISGSGRGGAD